MSWALSLFQGLTTFSFTSTWFEEPRLDVLVDALRRMPKLVILKFRYVDVLTTDKPRLRSHQATFPQLETFFFEGPPSIARLVLKHLYLLAPASVTLRLTDCKSPTVEQFSSIITGLSHSRSPSTPGRRWKPDALEYHYVFPGNGPEVTVDLWATSG